MWEKATFPSVFREPSIIMFKSAALRGRAEAEENFSHFPGCKTTIIPICAFLVPSMKNEKLISDLPGDERHPLPNILYRTVIIAPLPPEDDNLFPILAPRQIPSAPPPASFSQNSFLLIPLSLLVGRWFCHSKKKKHRNRLANNPNKKLNDG